MSAFDPATFLEATTTEAATRRPPLPVENPATEDHLYTGLVGEPKMREWTGKDDPSKSGIALDLPVTIDVPAELQEQFKLKPQIVLTDGFIINLTENGAIDWAPGSNRQARKWREATGLNVPGQPFAFRMLAGKVVKVQIKHDMYLGEVMDKIGNVFKS